MTNTVQLNAQQVIDLLYLSIKNSTIESGARVAETYIRSAEQEIKRLKKKWDSTREAFLHDPEHDNVTINWALDIMDNCPDD